MRPTSVTLLAHTWTVDTDGGRTILSTTTTAGLFCSAKPGAAVTEVDGTGRWTTIVPWELHFSADPGASAHDGIALSEGVRTHNLVVQGTYPAGVLGASYVVTAVERI